MNIKGKPYVPGPYIAEPATDKPRWEGVTLAQLDRGIAADAGGMIHIEGEGIAPSTKIGFGVATFLARIPDSGLSEEDARSQNFTDSRLAWIKEDLIPRGLVEQRAGSFYRTEVANGATYSFERNFSIGW